MLLIIHNSVNECKFIGVYLLTRKIIKKTISVKLLQWSTVAQAKRALPLLFAKALKQTQCQTTNKLRILTADFLPNISSIMNNIDLTAIAVLIRSQWKISWTQSALRTQQNVTMKMAFMLSILNMPHSTFLKV